MTSAKKVAAKKKEDLDVDKVFDDVLGLELDKCDIAVCVASLSKNDETPKLEHVQITDALANEFRTVVKHSLEKLRYERKNGDLLLREYEAGSKPDGHEIEYLELADYEFVKKQTDSIWPIVDMPLFQADDSFIAGLRFYVIIVQPKKGDPLFFFRSYGKSKELGRSSMFAAIFNKGHFDQIKEPTFLFDSRIDCLRMGEVMYVFGKDSFHKIFRFFEEVKRAALETLKTIKEHIPISNFDSFAQACEGHLQKMGKLNNIARKPYLSKITMTDIKKVIERNGLTVKVTKKGGNEVSFR